MPTHFDAIIIGAGQAGPSLAGRLTSAGRRGAPNASFNASWRHTVACGNSYEHRQDC
jgi:cation diffusion facilitator CzcD-associated flavoprotein CzcO